ncbi:MAG: hypothetical protein AAF127_09400 [Pseudomonadota bacterium]
MITFSDDQMQAMERAHQAAFPKRFHAWWREHISPKAKTTDTEKLIVAYRDEFDLVGVDEEEHKFLFLYARGLMPQMGDTQYLHSMDAILRDVSVGMRTKRLRAIAKEMSSHG